MEEGYKNSRMLYDATVNKWYNYFYDSAKYSSVWQDGYDDPTYLTFKVEFGDWGASVLDRSVLDLGVTTFKAQYADYDQLPMGLLNAPAETDGHMTSVWQTGAGIDGAIFASQSDYSAFTYLRSRNEDVRAEYIMHFVNGLFEIQKTYPYIFKKISGLEALEDFDVARGRRINDTELTLECYEGLDLKIKTLMEIYRKAAWDDVYQRWILPPNLREFKMIIYIFERRTFQKFDDGKLLMDNDVNLNVPVKVYECSPCEFIIGPYWNGDYDTIGESTAVGTNIKIKVKNVKTYYKNGLMNTNIHNYYNGTNNSIYNRLAPLLIYDLVDRLDRYKPILEEDTNSDIGSSIIGNTLNGVRSKFMSKNVFLSNEEYNDTTISKNRSKNWYTWGKETVKTPSEIVEAIASLYGTSGTGSASREIMKGGEYMSSSTITLQGYPNQNQDASFGITKTTYIDGVSDPMIAGLLYEYRAPFYYYYVNRPIGYGRLAFSTPIGNIIRLIAEIIAPRDVPSASLYILPLPEPFYGIPTNRKKAAREMEHLYGVSGKLINYANEWWNIGKLQQNDNPEEREIEQDLYHPNEPADHVDDDLNKLLPTSAPQSQLDMASAILHDGKVYHTDKFEELNDPRDLVEDELLKQNNNTSIYSQTLVSMENIHISKKQKPNLLSLTSLISHVVQRLTDLLNKERDKVDQDLTTLIPYSREIEQELNTLNNERNKEDQVLNTLNPKDSSTDQTLYNLYIETKYKSPVSLIEMNEPKQITQQEFEELNKPVEKTQSNLNTIIPKERDIQNKMINLVNTLREIPGLESITLNDTRNIPSDKLQSLLDQTKNLDANYQVDKDKLKTLITTIKSVENNEQLNRYDEDNKIKEQDQIEQLKSNNTLLTIENKKTNDQDALRKQNLLSYIKEYATNTDQVKQEYANELLKKKQELIKLTLDSIDKLPQVEMYTIKPGESNKENNDVLISLNDIKQIETNIELITLEDDNIRDLSTQSMVELNKSLDNEIKSTESMIGLTKQVEEKKQEKLVKLQDKKDKSTKYDEQKKKKRLGQTAKLKEPKEKKHNKIVY